MKLDKYPKHKKLLKKILFTINISNIIISLFVTIKMIYVKYCKQSEKPKHKILTVFLRITIIY